ncbi:MAG: magnesium transporter [Patescibacteria group bacterium]
MNKEKIQYADDDVKPVKLLLRLRLPSLFIGLMLGLVLSFVASRFEDVLSKNIAVIFFLPFIVYLADSVGTQTQNIYARDLRTGRANFKMYLVKETALGIFIGLIFSLITAPIVMFWFKSTELTLAVSLAVFGAIATAPLIALTVTELLQLEHTDPAVGAGPIATVIQDTISVLIYGLIASAIML